LANLWWTFACRNVHKWLDHLLDYTFYIVMDSGMASVEMYIFSAVYLCGITKMRKKYCESCTHCLHVWLVGDLNQSGSGSPMGFVPYGWFSCI
jgi:hypothetical protein